MVIYNKLQRKFDLVKWEDSVSAGKDMCGTYTFCKHCNKKNKYPCGAAIYKHTKGGKR